jgi:hypothetical protein
MFSWDPGLLQFGFVSWPLPIHAAKEAMRQYMALRVTWAHRWARLGKHVNLCRVEAAMTRRRA